ncbi:hypothetical protein Hanom_Chr06g00569311 [Helianthus anomalus]
MTHTPKHPSPPFDQLNGQHRRVVASGDKKQRQRERKGEATQRRRRCGGGDRGDGGGLGPSDELHRSDEWFLFGLASGQVSGSVNRV